MHRRKKDFTLLALLLVLKIVCFSQAAQAQNVTLNRAKRDLDFGDIVNKFNLLNKCLVEYPTDLRKNTEEDVQVTCTINIKKLDPNHALLLSPNDVTQFLNPDDNGDVKVTQGTRIHLSCPGIGNHLQRYPQYKLTTVKCYCGRIFFGLEEEDEIVTFTDDKFVCERSPEYAVIKGDEYTAIHYYDIGFYVGKGKTFLKLMTVAYHTLMKRSAYVMTTVSKSIAGGQGPPRERPYMEMDEAYGIDVQRQSFENQEICQPDKECPYINESKGYFFYRGYVAPNSSFVYIAANKATLQDMNTIPRWKIINDGNWARIEEHILTIASTLKKDLRVITGNEGQIFYDRVNSENEPVRTFPYLFLNKSSEYLRIPKYFYKLVYLPEGKRGVVYLTINNPEVNLGLNLHYNCKNPMTTIKGGKTPAGWQPKRKELGYSYICSVPDFLSTNVLHFDDPVIETVKDLLYIPSWWIIDPSETCEECFNE